MNIYSSTLSAENLYTALRAVPGLGFETYEPLMRPRLAARGWNILLYRTGSHQAFAKGYGDHGHGAASWADYGYYLAELFEIDPDMKVRSSANYDGAADFHRQTRYAFQAEHQPGTTPVQVRPSRNRPAHLREAPGFQTPAPVTEVHLTPALVASMHDSLAALDRAADGDSNDREIEAGRDCADQLILLLRMLGHPYQENGEV